MQKEIAEQCNSTDLHQCISVHQVYDSVSYICRSVFHHAIHVDHYTAERQPLSAGCWLGTLPQLLPHAPERPLPGPPSLSAASVTMLQSMTARAASFRAGSMHDALAPPSSVPSIDRFSSMSSWGASCSSPGSCHGSDSSPVGSCTAGDCADIVVARTRTL